MFGFSRQKCLRQELLNTRFVTKFVFLIRICVFSLGLRVKYIFFNQHFFPFQHLFYVLVLLNYWYLQFLFLSPLELIICFWGGKSTERRKERFKGQIASVKVQNKFTYLCLNLKLMYEYQIRVGYSFHEL